MDGDNVVANVNFESGKEVVIPIEDMKLWSPEDPHLYDVVVVCDDDMVRSYFGMRKFSEGVDKTGKNACSSTTNLISTKVFSTRDIGATVCSLRRPTRR